MSPGVLASPALSSPNVVIVASQRPLDVDALVEGVGANGDGDRVLAPDEARAFAGNAKVLRDDFAPVDQYLESSG